MKLIAYLLDGHSMEIRPAPVEREWMDHTGERFAYRCLPLNIANAHGWEVLCPAGFTAIWNGNSDVGAVSVKPHNPDEDPMALSHFGHGTLTFHIPCLFRTEAGWDLMAQGPVNRPKDGIAALSGIIETDWAPYTFTMNWIFTQPEVEVEFEKGEPFCHVFPVERGKLADVEPEIRPLSSAPELQRAFKEWDASRVRFNADLQEPGSQAQADRWQKMYYRGVMPDGEPGIEDHSTRLRLRPFKKT